MQILAVIAALIMVESSGNPKAVSGDQIGVLQIRPCMVKDVNRISGKHYTHKDAFSKEKSIEMCKIYFTFYGKVYKKRTGKEPSNEILARMWNSGPSINWKATDNYWRKVQKHLK